MLKDYIVYVRYEQPALNKMDAEHIIYELLKATKPSSIMAIRKPEKE